MIIISKFLLCFCKSLVHINLYSTQIVLRNLMHSGTFFFYKMHVIPYQCK